MSIDNHAAWPFCDFCDLASPKAPTVGSAGNKKIGSSVRDKNNSQSDWREDFFITEETEIKRNNGKNLWELWDL